MTATAFYTLSCNYPMCFARLVTNEPTLAAARVVAARSEWGHAGGFDFCGTSVQGDLAAPHHAALVKGHKPGRETVQEEIPEVPGLMLKMLRPTCSCGWVDGGKSTTAKNVLYWWFELHMQPLFEEHFKAKQAAWRARHQQALAERRVLRELAEARTGDEKREV